MSLRKMLCGAGIGLSLVLVSGVGTILGAAETASAPKPTAAKAPEARTASDKAVTERMLRVMDGDSAVPLMAETGTAAANETRQKHARDVKAVREAALRMDQEYMQAARERGKLRKEAKKAGKTKQAAPSTAAEKTNPTAGTGTGL